MLGNVSGRGDPTSPNGGSMRTRYGGYGSIESSPQFRVDSTRRQRFGPVGTLIYPALVLLLLGVCVYLIADRSGFHAQNDVVRLSSEEFVERSTVEGFEVDGLDVIDDPLLQVRIYNSYNKDSPIELYPWEHTSEPYRPSTMEVLDGTKETGDVVYRWEVDGRLQGIGQTIEAVFIDVGLHNCSITAYKEVGSEEAATKTPMRKHSFEVMVKYVRREIRSLTDMDREIFFNTVSVMQRVPTSVGRAIYGDWYRSKDYFSRKHLYYGGWKDCDHWHTHPGFVTSHMALTMEFEKALQAVNPMVSVPYWDFTIESAEYDLRDWRDSGVFSDDWFGSADARNTLHTPLRGRFAYVPVMTNAREYSATYNSYGQLKSAWNADPTPFATRHDHIYGFYDNNKPSGCDTYFNGSQSSDWTTLASELNGPAHGHIHEFMGGSWNHHDEAYRQEQTVNYMIYYHGIEALSKNLWKVDILKCPESCAPDTPWKHCRCTCDMDAIGDMSPYEVLRTSGVLGQVSLTNSDGNTVKQYDDDEDPAPLPGLTEEETKEFFASLLGVLCSPGHIGTMFQATSTDDITFWVLHPTVDRLWHLKRLTPGGYSEAWDNMGTCYGQDPDQFQPFSHNLFPNSVINHSLSGEDEGDATLAVNEVSAGKKKVDHPKKYYTNADLYELLHPGKEGLPYMYDSFRWPHCEALGYFIDGSPGVF